MTCNVRWGNETKTIILIELSEGWTWLELERAASAYLDLMNSVEHRISLIFYPLEGKFRIPPNALSNVPKLMRLTHPREDQTVIVGQAPLVKGLMNVIQKIYGLREIAENYHFVDTLDEAYQLLEKYEAEKPAVGR